MQLLLFYIVRKKESKNMEKIISLAEFPNVAMLFGNYNSNLKLLREYLGVKIVARDNLKITGEDANVEQAVVVVDQIKQYLSQNTNRINASEVAEIIKSHRKNISEQGSQNGQGTAENQASRRVKSDQYLVEPRTPGQYHYMQILHEYEIVFAIGPSGTGKTYLAVAMALECMKRGMVKKIVLVRPAVEAGEKLGYLPGDYQAKVNPYLRPLYDSLQNLMDYNRLRSYIEKDIIEVAPLAYMRGRTLEAAFVILDEAQNTSQTQMKMFLTRLGRNSRIVVTGDITQIDLVSEEKSGLIHAQRILSSVPGIGFVYLTKEDIVRHALVQRIIAAYEKSEENQG